MFYFLFIILVLILFFMTRHDKRASDKYLSFSLFSFAAAIVALVLYIAKDAYYYNVVNSYFSLPKEVWRLLMFAPLSREWIIRFLNLSALLVIYFFVQFSMSYLSDRRFRSNRRAQNLLVFYLAAQFALCDPQLQKTMYLALVPFPVEAYTYRMIEQGLHTAACAVNMGLVVYAVCRVLWRNLKGMLGYFFRYYAWGESVCFAFMAAAYCFIFWFAPMGLVRVSKLADYTFYRSVPLSESNIVYVLYPYYLVVTAAAVLWFLGKSISNRRKLENNELNIQRRIDAAETTSKTFCHYMKNELLSLQAEVELLETEDENARGEIVERCNHLYRRLDEIHRSTKMSQLTLRKTDLCALVDAILERMAADFKDCRIVREYGDAIPPAMIDAGYFEQALHNILSNAGEAMRKKTGTESVLRIQIQSLDNWIQLSVTDNGVGISRSNIDKIFTPFFSSEPVKKHWGVGLSLTYKIVAAHGGRIEVESIEREETTFRIMLPSVW